MQLLLAASWWVDARLLARPRGAKLRTSDCSAEQSFRRRLAHACSPAAPSPGAPPLPLPSSPPFHSSIDRLKRQAAAAATTVARRDTTIARAARARLADPSNRGRPHRARGRRTRSPSCLLTAPCTSRKAKLTPTLRVMSWLRGQDLSVVAVNRSCERWQRRRRRRAGGRRAGAEASAAAPAGCAS